VFSVVNKKNIIVVFLWNFWFVTFAEKNIEKNFEKRRILLLTVSIYFVNYSSCAMNFGFARV
jgi:hypothetical protein